MDRGTVLSPNLPLEGRSKIAERFREGGTNG
jgi:hypothetical protein